MVDYFCWQILLCFRAQAQQTCRQAPLSSYLVDILHNSTEQFLEAEVGDVESWIGLYRTPNTNNWYWDNYFFTNLTFDPVRNPHTYQKWAPNEPSAAGSGLDCVKIKNKLWYTANCSDVYYYTCQKSRYGQTWSNNDPDFNRLPGGLWKLTVSTPNNSWCWFEARIQSKLQIWFGYNLDPYSDFPDTAGKTIPRPFKSF